ncbi:MAG TPA: hypothetical protein VMP00_09755 [Burkholderiales bacterium]|nr:hypothetical protein [Burkholderiales bacterium]
MKFTGSHAIIALMGVLIAVLSWSLVYFARDELRLAGEGFEEEIETEDTAGFEDGRAVVRVTPLSQHASGIVTLPLAATESEAAVEIYGMVVDMQALFELRGRYLAAMGEVRARRAAVTAAEAEYRRMDALFRDDRNVSEQIMRNAQARYRAEQAQLEAAGATAEAVRDALRTAWGETIAGWATGAGSRELQSLLARETHLAQFVFPFGLPPELARATIRVAPVSGRAELRDARFVSDSPQAEPTLPGRTFFYLVNGEDLRAGARIVARVSTDGQKQTGVLLPNEAVIWHAGKAWAYLRKDEDTFARYEVSTARDLGNGWFNHGPFQPGDLVVVSGAQLLLSEEFKYQIRNENED